MPEWIPLIITFVLKHVVATIVGILFFWALYGGYGDTILFQKTEFFWITFAFCILVAILIGQILRGIINGFLSVKGAIVASQLDKDRKQRESRELEDRIVNEAMHLGPYRLDCKNADKTPFEVIGHDPAVQRLVALGVFKIVGRTNCGLRVQLTDFGIAVFQKRKDDIY